jgi:predicted transcriptional regulator
VPRFGGTVLCSSSDLSVQERKETETEENRADFFEMTCEIVRAQSSYTPMTAEEMAEAIKKVYRALKWVQAQEQKAVEKAEEETISGVQLIQRNKVICLECGKAFRQLSGKHLEMHGLTPRKYKEKHSIPLSQSPSARSLSAKRRRLAKERGLGEKLANAGRRKR